MNNLTEQDIKTISKQIATFEKSSADMLVQIASATIENYNNPEGFLNVENLVLSYNHFNFKIKELKNLLNNE